MATTRVACGIGALLLVISGILLALHPSATFTVGLYSSESTTGCISPFNELTEHYYSYQPPASDSTVYPYYVAGQRACNTAIRAREEAAGFTGGGGVVISVAAILLYWRRPGSKRRVAPAVAEHQSSSAAL